MKLYECPRNSMVRLLEDAKVPPGAPPIHKGDVIAFSHIDGMYSYCRFKDAIVHIAAWTEVELEPPTI